MSSFLPVDINQVSTLVSNVTNSLPPSLSQVVGNKLPVGQVGNSTIVSALQKYANQQSGSLQLGNLIQQQSAFPYKKQVVWLLLDRNGVPIVPPGNNPLGFSPGYMFKMHINPSNFVVTIPPTTGAQFRTWGGRKLQHWYPEIGTIAGDGIIGNMLERFNRDLKDSAAWNGFKQLLTIYQQNGIPYTPPTSQANRYTLQQQFAPIVTCFYDRVRYDGYFENISYTESQETPHTIAYNFTFRFLQYMDLADIPGLTREASVDASITNALIPQSKVNQMATLTTKAFANIKL